MTSFQPAADPRRGAGSLVGALAVIFEAVERRAVRVTAALVGGSFVALALLAAAIPAMAWLGRLPSWLPPALITASAAVIVAIMPLVLVPRRAVAAWTLLTYLSANGHEQWRRAMSSPFPDASGVDDWLRAHPDPPYPLARAQVLIMHGRGAEATLPDESELADLSSRFVREQLAWLAAFAADDLVGLERARRRLARLADEHVPGRDVAEARAIVRMIDAFDANVAGRDWLSILADARHELGPLARWTVLRWFVLPRLLYYGRISFVMFVVLQLVDLALRSA